MITKVGVTRDEIAERLQVSHSYIKQHFLPNIRIIDDSYPQSFDLDELREHLVSESVFSRQTKRINIEHEIRCYMRESSISNRPNMKAFIGKIPDLKKLMTSRSKMPSIRLEARDFWDFELIFNKTYSRDGKAVSDELFYRDMFKAGAIKIQLDTKAMYFIPQNKRINKSLQEILSTPIDDPQCFLVPADWKPFYKGLELLEKGENSSRKNYDYNPYVVADRERVAYSLFHIGLELSQVAQVTRFTREKVAGMWETYKKNRKQIIDEYDLDNKAIGKGR